MNEVQKNDYTQRMSLPGRLRHKWEYNIDKDHRETGCEDVN